MKVGGDGTDETKIMRSWSGTGCHIFFFFYENSWEAIINWLHHYYSSRVIISIRLQSIREQVLPL